MGCGMVPWASVLCELMRPDPCHVQACDFRKCLQDNKHHEHHCQGVLEAMEKCCAKYKYSSDCCSGYQKSKTKFQAVVPPDPNATTTSTSVDKEVESL